MQIPNLGANVKHPIQITFRNIPESSPIKKLVLNEAEQLEHFSDQIHSCKILIESPHRSHRKGNLFHVSIYLTIPGKTLVVSRSPSEHTAHRDLYLAIRDAFDEMRRQVQDVSKIQRTPYRIFQGPFF